MLHKIDRANSLLSYSVLCFLAGTILPIEVPYRAILGLGSVGLYVASEKTISKVKADSDQRQIFEASLARHQALGTSTYGVPSNYRPVVSFEVK